MNASLESARVVVCLLFFVYASWRDFKEREVSDIVWVIFGPLAFGLTFLQLYLYQPWQLPWYGICVGLTTAFAVLIYYSGAFGGADSKALICLALALPFPLRDLFSPLFSGISPVPQIFFPITVFSNSVVLSVSTAVYMFLRNFFWHQKRGNTLFEGKQREEFWGRKLLVLATGYKVPIQKLEEKWHLYPLE
ncbi:MAG: prepilin peptidase, partial [Thermoproteota archaeon]